MLFRSLQSTLVRLGAGMILRRLLPQMMVVVVGYLLAAGDGSSGARQQDHLQFCRGRSSLTVS